MKRILITGANSYIGISFENWLKQYPLDYQVDTVDMIGDGWKMNDFSGYDSVFHVAGIVHLNEKKVDKSLYYQVNCDLAFMTAKHAKEAGVKQFIFMSTMAVYGEEGCIGQDVIITSNTKPNPKSNYGKSKIQAEYKLIELVDEHFKLVIIRPPMIYGPNCPGNYARLIKFALKTPVFPMIENKRSMLHIDKLCQYLRNYVDNESAGLFLPQDDNYINTSLMVKSIAAEHGKNIILSKTMGRVLAFLGKRIMYINKVFGNLVYEK